MATSVGSAPVDPIVLNQIKGLLESLDTREEGRKTQTVTKVRGADIDYAQLWVNDSIAAVANEFDVKIALGSAFGSTFSSPFSSNTSTTEVVLTKPGSKIVLDVREEIECKIPEPLYVPALQALVMLIAAWATDASSAPTNIDQFKATIHLALKCGVPPPPVIIEPPPVIIEPPPVKIEPPPVKIEPPPVKIEPPPVKIEPPVDEGTATKLSDLRYMKDLKDGKLEVEKHVLNIFDDISKPVEYDDRNTDPTYIDPASPGTFTSSVGKGIEWIQRDIMTPTIVNLLSTQNPLVYTKEIFRDTMTFRPQLGGNLENMAGKTMTGDHINNFIQAFFAKVSDKTIGDANIPLLTSVAAAQTDLLRTNIKSIFGVKDEDNNDRVTKYLVDGSKYILRVQLYSILANYTNSTNFPHSVSMFVEDIYESMHISGMQKYVQSLASWKDKTKDMFMKEENPVSVYLKYRIDRAESGRRDISEYFGEPKIKETHPKYVELQATPSHMDSTGKKSKFMFGPFQEVFGEDMNNKTMATRMKLVKDKLNDKKPVFVIGYGSSGAGKTSSLIYNKADELDGVLISMLADLTDIQKIEVEIKEFYVNLSQPIDNINMDNHNTNSSPDMTTTKVYKKKFTKTGNKYLVDVKPGPGNESELDGLTDDEEDGDPKQTIGKYIATHIDNIENRHIAATTNNPNSSRSHSVATLTLKKDDKDKTPSILHIADFAGVENEFECYNIDALIDFANQPKDHTKDLVLPTEAKPPPPDSTKATPRFYTMDAFKDGNFAIPADRKELLELPMITPGAITKAAFDAEVSRRISEIELLLPKDGEEEDMDEDVKQLVDGSYKALESFKDNSKIIPATGEHVNIEMYKLDRMSEYHLPDLDSNQYIQTETKNNKNNPKITFMEIFESWSSDDNANDYRLKSLKNSNPKVNDEWIDTYFDMLKDYSDENTTDEKPTNIDQSNKMIVPADGTVFTLDESHRSITALPPLDRIYVKNDQGQKIYKLTNKTGPRLYLLQHVLKQIDFKYILRPGAYKGGLRFFVSYKTPKGVVTKENSGEHTNIWTGFQNGIRLSLDVNLMPNETIFTWHQDKMGGYLSLISKNSYDADVVVKMRKYAAYAMQKILQMHYVCKTRVHEGKHINLMIANMQQSILEIINRKGASRFITSPMFPTQPSLTDKSEDSCVQQLCSGENECYGAWLPAAHVEKNFASSIITDITDTKNLHIVVFGVINLSPKAHTRPQRQPYLDIRKLKLYLQKTKKGGNYYNASQKFINELMELNKTDVKYKYTNLKWNEIKAKLSNFNKENVKWEYIDEVIDHIQKHNMISLLGTLEFMDAVAKYAQDFNYHHICETPYNVRREFTDEVDERRTTYITSYVNRYVENKTTTQKEKTGKDATDALINRWTGVGMERATERADKPEKISEFWDPKINKS